MDLYTADVGAIQNGNMRNQAAESANEAIQYHNNQLANQLEGLRRQAASAATAQEVEQGIQGAISGYMDLRGLKQGISSYRDYVAKGQKKVSALQQLKAEPASQDGAVMVNDPSPQQEPTTESQPTTTTEPNATPTPEGAAAQGTADTNPTADDHTNITAGPDEEGGGDSLVKKGMSRLGLTEEGAEKLGKGVGALGSAAFAGVDIYNDIKQGKLGDNGWEDVGQVAQIGGAISDTIGTVFPPAELLGAGLGVVGGIFEDIGEAFETSKTKQEQQETDTATQQSQQQAEEQAPVQAQAQVAAAPRAVS
jgi:hypothetical protein